MLRSLNPFKLFIQNLILGIGTIGAFALFIYAFTLPLVDRMRGDAYQYMSIAHGFSSFSDALNYTGDRTYGYPLFLYAIKRFVNRTNLDAWPTAVAFVQFIFHILATCSFYLFFLKPKFKQLRVSFFIPQLIMLSIIAYPAFITYSTTPLTDTFCVDLLMLAATLHFLSASKKEKSFGILYAVLSGLLLGYVIMVRPSFLPAIVIFHIVNLWENSKVLKNGPLGMIKTLLIICATLIPLTPTLNHYHKFQLQNSEFVKKAVAGSFHYGQSVVRAYWSDKNRSTADIPGIHDPYLEKNFRSQCIVDSFGSLSLCLLSKPWAIPIYFTKKTIGLFDVPHMQPYFTDRTPHWFTVLQRCFEVPAFCGFISLIILCILQLFTRLKFTWIGLPWTLLIISFIGMQSLLHVEGRYGFAAIPFSFAGLIFCYLAVKKAGTKFFVPWATIMIFSATIFIFQIYKWDLLNPY